MQKDAGTWSRHRRNNTNAPEVPPVTDCGKEIEAEEAEQPTTPELLCMNWPEVQGASDGGSTGDDVGSGGMRR